MSEHQRSAWGAREDSSSVSAAAAAASSVWWPTAADQQSHHQQLLSHHQQQQLAAAVQQHEAAVRSTAAAAAAQQLFSYKMSNNNFQQQQQQQQQQNQITTTSSVSTSPSPTNNQQSQTNANNAAAAAAVAAGMRYGDYTAATGRPGDAALAANQAAQAAAAAAQWWSYPNSGVGINSTNIQNHLHNANAVNSLLNRGGVGVQRGGIIMNPKPRGRVTAYAYFVQAYREERKKMHPDETVVFKDFSRECAERWKTMSDKEKKRFHEMADKDKKRYDTEMQSYVPPKGEKVRGKKRKQMKDPNAPKRPLSAFFWFCNDERGQVKVLNPDYGVGDIAKELGRKWADAEPHVKQKYESMAEKDKARYEREMIEYKKKKPGDMMVPNEQLLIKQHESEGEDPEEDEEEE